MTKLSLACGLMLSLALVACASTPKPAASATAAPAGSTSGTAQASAKPKLICDEEKPLGSLLPQRICMTPEEAAARQKASQQQIQNMQSQGSIGPGAGSSSSGG
jgi:hypothetical protein